MLHSPICSAKLSQPSPQPTNKTLLGFFLFLKNGRFEAEIIKGLTETKTMHQKHITGHMHCSQGIQQIGLIFFLRVQICNCFSIDLHYSF